MTKKSYECMTDKTKFTVRTHLKTDESKVVVCPICESVACIEIEHGEV